MAFRVIINGTIIECDTAVEAGQLVQSLPATVSSRAPQSGLTPPNEFRSGAVSAVDVVRKLMHLVVEAASEGVRSSSLVRALGLQGARGLGPVVAALNNSLAQIGMNKDDVIVIRHENGERKWFAKPKAAEALQKLVQRDQAQMNPK